MDLRLGGGCTYRCLEFVHHAPAPGAAGPDRFAQIKAVKAGLDVTVNKLEAHYLAGGNVDRVVNALIAAHRADIGLTFERAAAIDLAGRNVLEAVQMSVNRRSSDADRLGRGKDGIELKCMARVTVRANIDRLVGGAGEATIIARVGEGSSPPSVPRPPTKRSWKTPT